MAYKKFESYPLSHDEALRALKEAVGQAASVHGVVKLVLDEGGTLTVERV